MQKAARRRRYLRNKRKKAFKRMLLYTTLTVVGLILIWHPVSASTLNPSGSSALSGSGGGALGASGSVGAQRTTVSGSPTSNASGSLPESSGASSSALESGKSPTAPGSLGSVPESNTAEESGTLSSPIDMLNQSFTAIHAKQTGYILHDYSTINHQFMEAKNLSNIGSELVQELNIQNAKVTGISHADDDFYNVDGFWPNQTEVHVTVSSFRDSASDGKAAGDATGSAAVSTGITTLAVTATGNGSRIEDIKQQFQMMADTVKKSGITPEMNACLEGYLGDRIVGVQAKDIISKSFAAIHAKPVEGLYTTLETSVSGYTNDYNTTYLTTDGRRMNVQLAVHADDYNHRTNVLVGTPIITTTY